MCSHIAFETQCIETQCMNRSFAVFLRTHIEFPSHPSIFHHEIQDIFTWYPSIYVQCLCWIEDGAIRGVYSCFNCWPLKSLPKFIVIIFWGLGKTPFPSSLLGLWCFIWKRIKQVMGMQNTCKSFYDLFQGKTFMVQFKLLGQWVMYFPT
jgi:hypothetical protein